MLVDFKKIGIGIAAIVIVGVVVGVVLSQAPDFDTVIENRDCDAVKALTNSDMEKATAEQQVKLTVLLGQCAFR